MRLALIVVTSIMLLFGAVQAYAETKIGFVNIAEIMEKSPQADSARKALEREFSGRDKQIASARDELLRLEEKLKSDGGIMSETKRRDLERDIVAKKRDYDRQRDEFREDFNIRRNEELSALQKKVYEVIIEIAKQEKYDLVLSQPVLYASTTIDITAKVLQKLNSAN